MLGGLGGVRARLTEESDGGAQVVPHGRPLADVRAHAVGLSRVVGEQHLLFVAEVPEEGGSSHFGTFGDRRDRDVVESVLGEELEGGRHDQRTGLTPFTSVERVRGVVHESTLSSENPVLRETRDH
ncbi:hypothetical protein BJF83_03785 [Nocardiopsis sp. CNR-923]|nr:hypothetical protein BJF83_03785 [Nocardiopsis sp. CNR-923]